MKTNKKLLVYYNNSLVGTLALMTNKKVAFEYDEDWITNGFSISPFSLPLEKKVFLPTKDYFSGLFGVFSDSLPDAWGNLLLERFLHQRGITNYNVLDKLAIIGADGMGALSYRPAVKLIEDSDNPIDLDQLAEAAKQVLNAKDSDDFDELYRLGGSSGGARPKVLLRIDNKDWIVKFFSHVDPNNAGLIEFEYAKCAKRCGINMTDVKLFSSKISKGYFGTVRFDRKTVGDKIKKVHMISAAALLEADYRAPSLDYHDLMKLTGILTNNNKVELEQMFRRMCFNVLAHNKDDHAKNFSYLYDEYKASWTLSPAFDITFSNTYFGEHTTSVNGKGTDIMDIDLVNVGLKAGLMRLKCEAIIKEIRVIVNSDLAKYFK